MNALILQMKNEWDSNPRLRIMFVVIAATLILYLLLWIIDARHERLNQLSHAQAQLSKIKNIQNEPIWYEREKDAASQRVKFQNMLWQASSKGLAQAEIQAFLRSVIDSNKLMNSKITLEVVEERPLTDGSLPIWRASAQLRASFKSSELQKVLWAISSSPKLITVRSLNFNLNTNKNSFSNFTLFVDAWFDATEVRQNSE